MLGAALYKLLITDGSEVVKDIYPAVRSFMLTILSQVSRMQMLPKFTTITMPDYVHS